MKDKVLETQITEAVEKIAKSLRFYAKEPIFCRIRIATRTGNPLKKNEPITDYYHITISYANEEDRGDIPIFDRTAQVEYVIDDKAHELIRRVTVLGEEGEEDGP